MASVLLSKFEQADICAGIACNLRLDGRLRTDYRPFTVETGFVSNTSGSARVRLVSKFVFLIFVCFFDFSLLYNRYHTHSLYVI